MDYEFKTTFWQDFSIADRFGLAAVKDTFKRAFEEWKNDYEYLTELFIVMNWKIWEHFDKGNDELAKCYDSLWRITDDYALTHLKGEELSYFYRVTD